MYSKGFVLDVIRFAEKCATHTILPDFSRNFDKTNIWGFVCLFV